MVVQALSAADAIQEIQRRINSGECVGLASALDDVLHALRLTEGKELHRELGDAVRIHLPVRGIGWSRIVRERVAAINSNIPPTKQNEEAQA